MNAELNQLVNAARRTIVARDWQAMKPLVAQLQAQHAEQAETYYLAGILRRAEGNPKAAIEQFEKGLTLDANRYDIAVEMANMYSATRQNGRAAELLDTYAPYLENSPRYLDMAGTVYTSIGQSHKAFPLYQRAYELQPDAQIFKVNLATCAVFLGMIDYGEQLYKELIAQNPEHRKNHYHLSRLKKAKDREHIEQMLAVIKGSTDTARDVPVFFALGKELEDLEEWDQSFHYYKKGCDGVKAQTKHDVGVDIAQIEEIQRVFDQEWAAKNLLGGSQSAESGQTNEQTPIFVLGLPRTGTTLVERILSSHPQVASVGETMFLQLAIRANLQLGNGQSLDATNMKALSEADASAIREAYIQSVSYRLADEPYFIEKLPFNFLYAGLIAAAWPQARIVNLVRHPMDSCFSMYKQVFTWAYKYSYSLEDLGQYYVAYDKLRQHWQTLLGDRFINIEYESLVADQEVQTRQLLDRLGLPFDAACLEFEKNTAPSTTASSVQVRSKVHSGSVAKWRHYEQHLQPLADTLRAGGVQFSVS